MGKYAYIVAASDNYRAGLIALLNSLATHSPTAHVELLSFQLPDDFLEQVEQRGGVTIHHGDHGEKGQVEATAIERFRIAYEVAADYDALCLLDCDMFATANCDTFFRAAAAGMIVVGSNGMVIDFNREHQDRYEIDLGADSYPYPKTHCTAPIFISHENTDWFEALYNSRRIDSWDDFLYLNALGIKMGKSDRMIVMPPYAFTGIHHFHVKPATGIIRKAGTILSGTEEQVYFCHGKYWDDNYNAGLLEVMEGYFRNEELGDHQRRQTERSLEVILEEFERYRNGDELL